MFEDVRLILHPGMPKCASSTIQSALVNARHTLASHRKFVLDKHLQVRRTPSSVEDPHGIPYRVIYDILDGEIDLEERLQATIENIKRSWGAGKLDLVLSSEVLSFINTNKGQLFHEQLARLFPERKLLVLVRAPWKHLFSQWRQGRYRDGTSFVEFKDRRMAKDGQGDYWKDRLDRFENVYGKIEALSLDLHQDVISHFFTAGLEVSDELVTQGTDKNPSLAPALCEILAKRPSLYEKEISDKRNIYRRHKKLLEAITQSTNDSGLMFSNIALQDHHDAMLELRNHYLQPYLNDLHGHYSAQQLDVLRTKLSEDPLFSSEDLIGANNFEKYNEFLESVALDLLAGLILDSNSKVPATNQFELEDTADLDLEVGLGGSASTLRNRSRIFRWAQANYRRLPTRFRMRVQPLVRALFG